MASRRGPPKRRRMAMGTAIAMITATIIPMIMAMTITMATITMAIITTTMRP
jgi:hypothetical protein